MRKLVPLVTCIVMFAVSLSCAEQPLLPQEEEPQRLGYRDAVVLGAVEGFTEYLPISSTGHLILANKALGHDLEQGGGEAEGSVEQGRGVNKAAVDAYSIVIQSGAILAVLVIYWKDVSGIFFGMIGRNRQGFLLGRNILLAFLPAAELGFLFNSWIEQHLFGHIPVAAALIVGTPIMLGAEHWRKKRSPAQEEQAAGKELHDISPLQALFVGLLQSCAMWPGLSRSMITICGGYVIGLSPERAARFSFLLGLVTLGSASFYTTFLHWDIMYSSIDAGPALLGVFFAGICAALSVKWFVGYLSRKGLALFAWYRMIVAVAVLVVFGI